MTDIARQQRLFTAELTHFIVVPARLVQIAEASVTRCRGAAMRMERVSIEEADRIASALEDKRVLEGTYDMSLRPGYTDRYQIIGVDHGGEYHCMTGVDRQRGRVTLLRSRTEAILLLEATTKPIT